MLRDTELMLEKAIGMGCSAEETNKHIKELAQDKGENHIDMIQQKSKHGRQQNIINQCRSGLLNFKKSMAILILALANFLLDMVRPGDPTMFKAGTKILGFGVPRWPENAFPSFAPWIYQCAKAPHFLTMYHKIPIHLHP